jgi:hypothetical protein
MGIFIAHCNIHLCGAAICMRGEREFLPAGEPQRLPCETQTLPAYRHCQIKIENTSIFDAFGANALALAFQLRLWCTTRQCEVTTGIWIDAEALEHRSDGVNALPAPSTTTARRALRSCGRPGHGIRSMTRLWRDRRVLWLAETHWRLRLGGPAHRFLDTIAAEGPAITEALAKLGRKSSSAQQLWQHCHRHGKVNPDDLRQAPTDDNTGHVNVVECEADYRALTRGIER